MGFHFSKPKDTSSIRKSKTLSESQKEAISKLISETYENDARLFSQIGGFESCSPLRQSIEKVVGIDRTDFERGMYGQC